MLNGSLSGMFVIWCLCVCVCVRVCVWHMGLLHSCQCWKENTYSNICLWQHSNVAAPLKSRRHVHRAWTDAVCVVRLFLSCASHRSSQLLHRPPCLTHLLPLAAQPIFCSLTECGRDHLLLCNQKNSLIYFFPFYVPVICLIMASEHEVKHKGIFGKSPEVGFTFAQTQWANPNWWKQQHSSNFRPLCLIFCSCRSYGNNSQYTPHHLKA